MSEACLGTIISPHKGLGCLDLHVMVNIWVFESRWLSQVLANSFRITLLCVCFVQDDTTNLFIDSIKLFVLFSCIWEVCIKWRVSVRVHNPEWTFGDLNTNITCYRRPLMCRSYSMCYRFILCRIQVLPIILLFISFQRLHKIFL